MALQKTVTSSKGGVSIANAHIEICEIEVTKTYAGVLVRIYIDQAAHDANEHDYADQARHGITGDDFTTYINTPHATKTILERVQDFLLAEVYAEAIVV